MSRTLRRLATCITTLLLASAGLSSQGQVTFRASVDYVEINAVVTDRSGAIVRGLTREDFEVREDGKPQAVTAFTFIDLAVPEPVTEASGFPGATSDSSTNARALEGRIYVIVLDAFHIDASRTPLVRQLARQFIDRALGPGDVAAVIHIGGPGSANQMFTADRALLELSIGQFIGGKAGSATMNKVDSMIRNPSLTTPEDAEAGVRAQQAKVSLESARRICASLGSLRGRRKSLVLFSEGIDLDTSDLIGRDPRAGGTQGSPRDASRDALEVLQGQRDMLLAAARANVTIFPIDPRGNTIGEDVVIQQSSTPIGTAPPTLGVAAEARRGQGTLRSFAEESGGLAVVGTNNMSAGFARIVRANSSYYVLGYAPTNTRRDGRLRQISVRVKRSGMELSARKSYFAPVAEKPAAPGGDAGTSARMRELLTSTLSIPGLGVSVAVSPVGQRAGDVVMALVMELDGKALTFAERDGQLSNTIEVAFLAADPNAKVHATNRSAANLRLQPAQRAALANGLRWVVEFAVPPGRYQLRAGVRESVGSLDGSAVLEFEAPRFERGLAIGAPVMTSSGASEVPTTGTSSALQGVLSAPPTSRREFMRSETLTLAAQVSRQVGTPWSALTAIVRAEDGRDLFRTTAARQGPDAPDIQSSLYVATVPLASLSPGTYGLVLQAAGGAEKPTTRTTVFVVR